MSALIVLVLVFVGCGSSAPPAPSERPSLSVQAGDAFAQVSRCRSADWSVEEKRAVPSFKIESDPVSCPEWDACVAAGKCQRRASEDCRGMMMLVRAEGAQEFCRWHGARLPTLLEWTRAARGDTKVLHRDSSQPCVDVWNGSARGKLCSYIGPTGMRFKMTTGWESEWTADVDCDEPDDGSSNPLAVGLDDKGSALQRISGTAAQFRCARSGEE